MNAPYSSFVSARQTNEDAVKDQQRMYAIHNSGYSFIVMRLKDKRMKKVSAVDDLNALEAQEDGETVWKFSVVQRPLVFRMDPARGRIAYMLDTDYNRDFLASHSLGDYWVISDVVAGESGITKDDVIEDIKTRCKILAEGNKYVHSEEKKTFIVPKAVKPESEEEIDKQIEELMSKKKKFKKVQTASPKDIIKVSKDQVFKKKKTVQEEDIEQMPFPDSDLIKKDTDGNYE